MRTRLCLDGRGAVNIAESDCGVHIQRMQASCSRELDLRSSCLGRREDVKPPFFGDGCGSLNIPLGVYSIVDLHL